MDKKWYCCPICGQKLCKCNEKALAQGVYIKCKRCTNEVEIKIEK